jgi:hypothetical protein
VKELPVILGGNRPEPGLPAHVVHPAHLAYVIAPAAWPDFTHSRK